MNLNHSYIIQGDNLEVLNALQNNYLNAIDLIYIDPPYQTNQIFTTTSLKSNSISRELNGELAYHDTLSFEDYLKFLEERLVAAHPLLSENGSIYVHVDYKVGHYVRILMDKIFGRENFLADISRIKCNPKNFKRNNFGNIKDCILFYTKKGKHIWNEIREEYSQKDLENLFPKIDDQGEKYTTVPLHAPGETINGNTSKKWKGKLPPLGRHWRSSPQELEELDEQGLIKWSASGNPRKKVFLKDKLIEGKKIQDIWEFKDPQKPKYPTEKNPELLKRIIQMSSRTESIVMDFFAGSGGFLMQAHNLGRRFIGIDNSEVAMKVMASRFEQGFFISFSKVNFLKASDLG